MRWPFVSRSRYADLYERYQLALKATAKAREEQTAFRTAATTAGRQFAEADAANRRLVGRTRRLRELLEHHRDQGSLGLLQQHRDRLERALRACARYRDELRAAPAQLHARLTAELHRSEKARAVLEAERCELIRVNDSLNQQLRDRAEGVSRS